MSNTQKREPFLETDPEAINNTLDVVDIWHTIQGEGPLSGTPSVFVRLAGCNLQCPHCDTDYTSDRRKMSASELAVRCSRLRSLFPSTNTLVITGGEPCRQDIAPFCKILVDDYWDVQIETNGTLWRELPEDVIVVCCPKTPKIHPNWENENRIDAYKYVIEHGKVSDEDGLPTSCLGMAHPPARPPKNYPREQVYCTPLDVKSRIANEKHNTAMANSCMAFGYTAQLQIHKYLDLK